MREVGGSSPSSPMSDRSALPPAGGGLARPPGGRDFNSRHGRPFRPPRISHPTSRRRSVDPFGARCRLGRDHVVRPSLGRSARLRRARRASGLSLSLLHPQSLELRSVHRLLALAGRAGAAARRGGGGRLPLADPAGQPRRRRERGRAAGTLSRPGARHPRGSDRAHPQARRPARRCASSGSR